MGIMITRLAVSNFRSLGANVEIQLGKLNFLVGANGSGKSNILHVLTLVREAARTGLPGAIAGNGIEAIRRQGSGRPRNVKVDLELSLNSGAARYGFEISSARSEEYRVKAEWLSVSTGKQITQFRVKEGKWDGPEDLRPSLDGHSLAITSLGGDARIKPLWDFLAGMMVYSIYPDTLRKPRKYSSETFLKPGGSNWVSILHRQEKLGWKQDLVRALAKLTGDIDDIRVVNTAGFLTAQLRHKIHGQKDKKWLRADLESDGTLRVAGLLTALLQAPALPVIGIEEPELAVHPGALTLICDHLNKASRRSQVIVATHSPILLNHIDLEKSQVLVVQKEGAVTSAHPLPEQYKRDAQQQLLSLGGIMVSGDLQLSLFEDHPGA